MTTRAILTLTTPTDDQALRELAGTLPWSAFGIICYLKVRKLEGREELTRDELVEKLPIKERTIDGALARLRKQGLIQSVKVERAA